MENRILFVLRADGSFTFYGNTTTCATNENLPYQTLQKHLKKKGEYETHDRKVWRGYLKRGTLNRTTNGSKTTVDRRRDPAGA